ncbi:MAG: Mov34/MPN/PAD-1 family protein [Anaerolineae bacterium]|nr:Mov34/MPN/PAD-1 family protein [Anaerolineae bacterium]
MQNLVTHYLHTQPYLPPSDALFYQYIVAANGVYVRAENAFLDACIPVTVPLQPGSAIRGLLPLPGWLQLKVPPIPFAILEQAVADAQAAIGQQGDLHETLFYIVWEDGRYRLIKPDNQTATPSSVKSVMVETGTAVIMDIHSHGRMPPFFSPQDDKDETRLRFYGVMGSLDTTPQFQFRLGIYGHWAAVPVHALFEMVSPNREVYQWL